MHGPGQVRYAWNPGFRVCRDVPPPVRHEVRVAVPRRCMPLDVRHSTGGWASSMGEMQAFTSEESRLSHGRDVSMPWRRRGPPIGRMDPSEWRDALQPGEECGPPMGAMQSIQRRDAPMRWQGRVPTVGRMRPIHGKDAPHPWEGCVPSMGRTHPIHGRAAFHLWKGRTPSMRGRARHPSQGSSHAAALARPETEGCARAVDITDGSE